MVPVGNKATPFVGQPYHRNNSSSSSSSLSETKIDYSFPKGQFQIKGFGDPLGIDRNVNGGGTLFYVREDIPAKLL